ncbi:MAG TPA: hypothetical protein VL635_16260 [Trinickia sp.]|jgi:hypothetical protein|nr:hypothetical protein [Trinickia sp.]
MTKPPLSLLALLTIAPILAGGCSLYANPSACEAQMRRAAAEVQPAATLSISHVGVGIKGARVVVEGSLKTAAAAPAEASDASGASAVSSNSSTQASEPAKQAKSIVKAAALECTFDEDRLTALRWLAPPELANPPAPAAPNG